jgi:hypothetical protein
MKKTPTGSKQLQIQNECCFAGQHFSLSLGDIGNPPEKIFVKDSKNAAAPGTVSWNNGILQQDGSGSETGSSLFGRKLIQLCISEHHKLLWK